MIHVSEISEERVKAEDVLKTGQVVKVKIIKVDRSHRKMRPFHYQG